MNNDFIISEDDPTEDAEQLYEMRFVKNLISGCHLHAFVKPSKDSLISHINIFSSLSSKHNKENYRCYNDFDNHYSNSSIKSYLLIHSYN